MDRKEQYTINFKYIKENNLDQLIDFEENSNYTEQVFDSVSGNLQIPVPPETNDLIRLHKLIRERKSFTVLEFGLGYSTIIMADAIYKNKLEWESIRSKPDIRNSHMFKLFSVDASSEWIEITKKRIPNHLKNIVNIKQSNVTIGTFNNQLCHYYDDLHDIIPDFIYLDGPSPKDVKGKINGLSFNCDERTVMAADLLLMESTFLPGTFIIIDGRTNNARFLERNFTREYKVTWNRENDVSTFELTEDRLGKYNILGSDFYQ